MNWKKIALLIIAVGLCIAFTLQAVSKSGSHSNQAILASSSGILSLPVDNRQVDRSNHARVTSYAEVLDSAIPAVVAVYPSRVVRYNPNRQANPLEDLLRRYYGLPPRQNIPDQAGEVEERKLPYGMGSGVIVSENGYVITNHHVVTDDQGNEADEILVKLADGREVTAEYIGSDPQTDVAVIKMDEDALPFVPMANSENLKVGDIVFAIGNPLQVGLTVTMGIVSATGRSDLNILGQSGFENFIQTDASINPGNSGGALVDAEGRLIGINTAIISRTGNNIGIGFAIPVNMARKVLLDLVNMGKIDRGYLGVRISDISKDMAEAFQLENPQGALIQQVEKDRPADAAGIVRGDIIVAVDGKEIKTSQDLRFSISQLKSGESVPLTLLRNGKEVAVTVTLTSWDTPSENTGQESAELFEGIIVEPVSGTLKEKYGIENEIEGLVITTVRADSPFSPPVQEGMVILEINHRKVDSIQDARKILRQGSNALYIYDRGSTGYIALRIR